jgi:membrane-associated phospholipid phosphatase
MPDLTRPWPFDLNRTGWAALALGFAVLLAVTHFVDVPVSLWAQSWPGPVRDIFFAITDFGLSDWFLIPSLALFAVSGLLALLVPAPTPKRALRQLTGVSAYVFLGVGLPGLVSSLIKRGIGRARPELYEQSGPLSFESFINDWTHQSFPSGHATTAFAVCFVVSFVSPRWFPLALAYALAVALSRIVVGAHYPTDVLAGAVVGTLGAYAVRNFFASRNWVFRRRGNGRVEMRELSAVRRLLRRRG